MRISPRLQAQKIHLAAKRGIERARQSNENQRISTIILACMGLFVLLAATLQLDGIAASQPLISVDPKNAGPVASIYLTDSSPADSRTQYLVGQRDSLSIMIDNGGAVLQEASVQIHYPSHLIAIDSINTNDSICTGVRTRITEPQKGLISFNCTIPSQAVTTQIGKLATIWYVPIAAGSAAFSIVRDTTWARSGVPGNAAEQRDVLKSTRGLNLSITAREDRTAPRSGIATLLTPDIDQQTPPESFTPSLVSVISKNYSPEQSCTSALTLSFQWLTEEGVNRFDYSWGTDPDVTEPTTPTVSSSIDLPTKPGQLYYFHLRAVGKNGNEGPVQRLIIPTCAAR